MTGASKAKPDAGDRVIWITGLSGSGKTTLARELLPRLPQPRLLLDGDEMRGALELLAGGYGREERLRLALTYARLCGLAAGQGQTVVCATISMFHEVRRWNRENLPGYFEIYLEASAEDCRDHDYKQVYAADREVMGVQLVPELPLEPDVVFKAHTRDAAALAGLVMDRLAAASEGH
jgi:adenylylsulfate kinase